MPRFRQEIVFRASEPIVNLTLMAAIVTLAFWIVLTFIVPVGAAITHVLVITSVVLFARRVLLGKTRL